MERYKTQKFICHQRKKSWMQGGAHFWTQKIPKQIKRRLLEYKNGMKDLVGPFWSTLKKNLRTS